MVLAQADPPSGGAPISEVIAATAGAAVVTAAILLPLIAYRAGRFPALGRVVDGIEERTNIPAWAGLSATLLTGSLLVAVFGMYWDISLHIDDGRDAGPLANPAHYFILVGLFGVFMSGLLGIALAKEPTRTSIEVTPGWHAPVGALMIAACGAVSLLAFPLDDVWHRLFGQDVTLWGPTHLMLIGGAALSLLGGWALQVEADELRREAGRPPGPWSRLREVALCGGFLLGVSTFQAEFDFSVPQFALVLHPILLMLAAGLALVSARIRFGPGGALVSLVLFLAVRGLLAVTVGGVFEQTVPTFPLYLTEALCVEAVALLWMRGRPVATRPVSFGLVSGVAIGTVGLAGEWAWSQAWIVTPWNSALLPDAVILGFLAAVAGGVLGGFIGRCLTPSVERVERMPRPTVPVAAALAVGVLAFAIPATDGDGAKASFQLTEVTSADDPGGRTVNGTIRLDPPDAAEDARWFNVTAWQGGQRSEIHEPERTGPGTYRITEPIHVDGTWKSTLRLHSGRDIVGLPVFLPKDEAIPAPETPATSSFTREFILDKKNLQREQKDDVPGWLILVAYLSVLAIALALIGMMAWGLRRLEARATTPRDPGTAQADARGKPSGKDDGTGRGVPAPA